VLYLKTSANRMSHNVNDESGRTWKETVAVSYKVLFSICPEMIQKSTTTSQDLGQSTSSGVLVTS